MGEGKLTLPYRGGTIIGSVVSLLIESSISGVSVVLGHHADTVRNALAGYAVDFVVNPSPENGMLSSVKCGLRSLPPDIDAFLIALGDQPDLSISTIRALQQAAAVSPRVMFIPEHGGKRGHPVLFKAVARDSILSLAADSGLNAWRALYPDLIETVPIDSADILRDIDTPQDYREALSRLDPET